VVGQHGEVRLGVLVGGRCGSLYSSPPERTHGGRPVLPDELNPTFRRNPRDDRYACKRCGNPQPLRADSTPACARCGCGQWNRALDRKRER